jgi:hypothetical protein
LYRLYCGVEPDGSPARPMRIKGVRPMIRSVLIAAAALTAVAFAGPAVAQTGAPVRTLAPSDSTAGSTVLIAERTAPPCADKSCAAKPKRGYVGAAPLGW